MYSVNRLHWAECGLLQVESLNRTAQTPRSVHLSPPKDFIGTLDFREDPLVLP